MNQNERNFWLDSSLFIMFLSTMLTGFFLWLLIPNQTAAVILGFNRDFWRAVHICTGLASAVGNVIHIIWHRDWLKALRKRPLVSLATKVRVNHVIDRFIWIILLGANVSGALDWILSAYGYWGNFANRFHVVFGLAWLIGIAAHLAFHCRWITASAKRYLRVKKQNLVIVRVQALDQAGEDDNVKSMRGHKV